ncbi:hypothetical protein QBZ16_003705, partial [Prototheca wickerhamii]
TTAFQYLKQWADDPDVNTLAFPAEYKVLQDHDIPQGVHVHRPMDLDGTSASLPIVEAFQSLLVRFRPGNPPRLPEQEYIPSSAKRLSLYRSTSPARDRDEQRAPDFGPSAYVGSICAAASSDGVYLYCTQNVSDEVFRCIFRLFQACLGSCVLCSSAGPHHSFAALKADVAPWDSDGTKPLIMYDPSYLSKLQVGTSFPTFGIGDLRRIAEAVTSPDIPARVLGSDWRSLHGGLVARALILQDSELLEAARCMYEKAIKTVRERVGIWGAGNNLRVEIGLHLSRRPISREVGPTLRSLASEAAIEASVRFRSLDLSTFRCVPWNDVRHLLDAFYAELGREADAALRAGPDTVLDAIASPHSNGRILVPILELLAFESLLGFRKMSKIFLRYLRPRDQEEDYVDDEAAEHQSRPSRNPAAQRDGIIVEGLSGIWLRVLSRTFGGMQSDYPMTTGRES